MSIEKKISDLIEAPLEQLGYELIRVKNIGNDVMQIIIDNEHGVNINDCTKATKLIRNILHVAELSGDFGLEVSSPGVERPLVKPIHFQKYIGSIIKLNSTIPVEGQKKFIGKLEKFDQEHNIITLTCEERTVNINFEQVQAASLFYKG